MNNSARIFIAFTFLAFAWCAGCRSNTGSTAFTIHRGANIAHFLSQSNQRGEKRDTRFTEEDVVNIADAGFDHIRLPIDEEQMWDSVHNKEPEAWALLHRSVKNAQKYGLKVLVDLHIVRSHYFMTQATNSLFSDPAEQDWLIEMWRQLSEELKQYPNNEVAYEILNEAVATRSEDWNSVLLKTISAIRQLEPQRVIFAGPNMWQMIDYADSLKLPQGDVNLVISFHFYEPFPFTHYRAGWTPFKDVKPPVHYPGTVFLPIDSAGLPDNLKPLCLEPVYNREWMKNRLSKIAAKGKELGLPVYCGEFGVLHTVELNDRIVYYKDIMSVMDELGISYAFWGYKGGFDLPMETFKDIFQGKK